MTIKRLSELLKTKEVPYVGTNGKNDGNESFYLDRLKDKKVAIEMSGIVYKQNAGAINRVVNSWSYEWSDTDGWNMPSEEDILPVFKKYITSYMTRILDTGIIPIAIMEGKGPDMKIDTLKQRSESKASQRNNASDHRRDIDINVYKKYLKGCYHPTKAHMDITILVLKELGITTLHADYEAEGVCAELVNDPDNEYHCDCVMIDDYDIFMYGCKAVIRNIRSTSTHISGFECVAYSFMDILTSLNLIDIDTNTGEPMIGSFIDALRRFRLLCILSGSDYHPNIHLIGIMKVLKLINNGTIPVVHIRYPNGKEYNVHKYVLDTYEPHIIYGILSRLKGTNTQPSTITKLLDRNKDTFEQSDESLYTIIGTSNKRVDTYEEACILEPRFKTIPYYDILRTLRSNTKYKVIN